MFAFRRLALIAIAAAALSAPALADSEIAAAAAASSAPTTTSEEISIAPTTPQADPETETSVSPQSPRKPAPSSLRRTR